MGFVIAVSNQKGGVGKTTSSINLGAELACAGRRVLVVDFDPQGNASSGLGVSLVEGEKDLYDMFFAEVSLANIIRPTSIENLFLAPSSADLVGIEIELGKTPGRELILKSEIALLSSSYDYILIDCPPSSGLLTLNALGAAEHIIIPLQAEYYALEGLSALMNTVNFVQQTFNPNLDILGVFLTMYDSRTRLASQVDAEARNYFGAKVFETKIPRNVRLSEAPSHGLPICKYDGTSAGALAYHELAKELDERLFGVQREGSDSSRVGNL
jgi:chromosome partitioning protein